MKSKNQTIKIISKNNFCIHFNFCTNAWLKIFCDSSQNLVRMPHFDWSMLSSFLISSILLTKEWLECDVQLDVDVSLWVCGINLMFLCLSWPRRGTQDSLVWLGPSKSFNFDGPAIIMKYHSFVSYNEAIKSCSAEVGESFKWVAGSKRYDYINTRE